MFDDGFVGYGGGEEFPDESWTTSDYLMIFIHPHIHFYVWDYWIKKYLGAEFLFSGFRFSESYYVKLKSKILPDATVLPFFYVCIECVCMIRP